MSAMFDLSQDSYQELYTVIQSGSVLSILLYFKLIYIAHLLNKQTGFFDKMCQ